MISELELRRPDDWHLHLRDGEMLKAVLPYSSQQYGRAIIMPNLVLPLKRTKDIVAYRERILAALPEGHQFTPLMTMYLADDTDPDDLVAGFNGGIVEAVKFYPANATTNSAQGVSSIDKVSRILDAMQRADIPLLIHCEVTEAEVDIFDREARFIETILLPITVRHPELRIVIEHATTAEAVDFVMESGSNIGATITPQHVFLNRNALFKGGIRPHNYCLPILKREKHRAALVKAITSSSGERFFLGTDSAPHSRGKKESACGCAGAFNTPIALALYASVFDAANALDKLEAFTSINGPNFYRKPVNEEIVTLIRKEQTVPEIINVPDMGEVVPFLAGEKINWMVKDSEK
ncbi:MULTISPECIES: dihydroorotase [unclassified Serratia (in: enterobacteria)]|uniref:dihydroorotase n=1 Tax=unclassified Serratia (in: enterobacteria) TaxID=2647522 RepID=UPI00046ADD79|nr:MULTISPECIES: dihydroorotase [unclassified Serratia (in: enterobacteria)]